jgi:predicted NodU family carbamoyl transferase
MNILAIHTSHDGSISIVCDNTLIVHQQIDRFNKFKHDSIPSFELIQKIINLKITFDVIIYTSLNLDSFYNWEDALINFNIINKDTTIIKYLHKEHHLFHKYCTYSFYDHVNVLVFDGDGALKENETEQISLYINNDLKYFKSGKNIGKIYQQLSLVFFKKYFSENKLMALSTYGNLDEVLFKKFNLDFFNKNKIVCDNFEDNVAINFQTTFQKWFESEVMIILKNFNKEETICLTGGCAQNILNNSNLIENGFKIEVDPMCTDQGISLGAINYYLNKPVKLNSVYLGFEPIYNLNIFNEKYKIISVTKEDVVNILENNPLAIYQGRSEQGQRGLGNRSLLINPTLNNCKELLEIIKKREWFRPYACTILEEECHNYFYMSKKISPYMLFVFKVKEKFENLFKNVLSKDKKCRIQTLNYQNNPNYYDLLKSFYNKTKIPFILNTSLNLSGMPVVETLEDLKFIFDTSPLKYAYLPDINKLIINESIQ